MEANLFNFATHRNSSKVLNIEILSRFPSGINETLAFLSVIEILHVRILYCDLISIVIVTPFPPSHLSPNNFTSFKVKTCTAE